MLKAISQRMKTQNVRVKQCSSLKTNEYANISHSAQVGVSKSIKTQITRKVPAQNSAEAGV